MTRIRLQFVQEFLDRHGKPRRYFRRPGFERVPLPGLPGSTEFMEAYQAALACAPLPVAVKRSPAGSLSAAIASYYRSVAFLSLAPSSQQARRNILERIRVEHGAKAVAALQRSHVQAMVSTRAATPGAAQNFLKALRGVLQHCVVEGVCTEDPTLGVRSVKIRSAGIYTWTEADIATFEARHPIGTRARLALGLLLYTAQRRSDVVRMGRQHVTGGTLHVRQRKTGATLAIPVTAELQIILDATPSEHLTFLTSSYGRPFTPTGFSTWFRKRCDEAKLPRCSAHGLRKAACRRLAEAGCSANEIAAISGHASLREVERYTKAADQARMARNALGRAKAGTVTVKPKRQV